MKCVVCGDKYPECSPDAICEQCVSDTCDSVIEDRDEWEENLMMSQLSQASWDRYNDDGDEKYEEEPHSDPEFEDMWNESEEIDRGDCE